MRQTLQIFADEMEKKLVIDVKKGPWEDIDVDYLWHRAADEMSELYHALKKYKSDPGEWNARQVRQECADVASFAMMIFSQHHSQTVDNQRGNPIVTIMPMESYTQDGENIIYEVHSPPELPQGIGDN